MGKTYRVGTWKVTGHVNFAEKPDVRKSVAVLRCLSGVINLKEVMVAYPQLGIDLNGKPVTELEKQ
ncbi:hypothetical protein EDC32_10856 [Laceyella sacchari]|jgi:hypothetical protein|uniref:hypothetical protein n=1 Tax=Laceyella sacchari TaxID=37482 RepID=UPI000AF635BB|nr:hypothetical protein [Laceyella sacchari]TCW35344.1 hypothetical protein EDC32_10856 [Laceyella sacchari]